MSLDPITLSVIQAGLQQACDEMDLSFSRAAFSPVIAEANDRSDGIYAADDGALISQGAGGLPVFVGTMQYSTAELIRLIGEGEVAAREPRLFPARAAEHEATARARVVAIELCFAFWGDGCALFDRHSIKNHGQF